MLMTRRTGSLDARFILLVVLVMHTTVLLVLVLVLYGSTYLRLPSYT